MLCSATMACLVHIHILKPIVYSHTHKLKLIVTAGRMGYRASGVLVIDVISYPAYTYTKANSQLAIHVLKVLGNWQDGLKAGSRVLSLPITFSIGIAS